jgi:hypothetical protein
MCQERCCSNRNGVQECIVLQQPVVVAAHVSASLRCSQPRAAAFWLGGAVSTPYPRVLEQWPGPWLSVRHFGRPPFHCGKAPHVGSMLFRDSRSCDPKRQGVVAVRVLLCPCSTCSV